MQVYSKGYAVEHGIVVPESDLSPAVRAILREMAQTVYLIDRYREGIAVKSRRYAELEAELAVIERQP